MFRQVRLQLTVCGSLPFPIDMLRYDECWPKSEEDSHSIYALLRHDAADISEPITIHLLTDQTVLWQPTLGRWQSFGWSVIALTAA